MSEPIEAVYAQVGECGNAACDCGHVALFLAGDGSDMVSYVNLPAADARALGAALIASADRMDARRARLTGRLV